MRIRLGRTKRRRPTVTVGSLAPDFKALDQDGREVHLYEVLKSKSVVLYFYPKDETPGCSAEARDFRDAYPLFVDAGAEVIGISSDSVGSHAHFVARQCLPFTLVSDNGGQVRRAYGVASTWGLLPGRVTFVIDRQGRVKNVFSSQLDFKGHVETSLVALGKGT